MMSLVAALTAAGAFLGALVTALVVRPTTASTASTVVLPAAVAVVTFLSVFVVLARGRERRPTYAILQRETSDSTAVSLRLLALPRLVLRSFGSLRLCVNLAHLLQGHDTGGMGRYRRR